MSRVEVKSVNLVLSNGEVKEISAKEARELYESLKNLFEKPTTYKFEFGSTLPTYEEAMKYKSPMPSFYGNWHGSSQWGK